MIRIVALGPGDPESVPAAALAALAAAGAVPVYAVPGLRRDTRRLLGVRPRPLGALDAVPARAVIAAPDAEAHRIALALPDALTLPDRAALRGRAIGAEVAFLAGVGRRLRRDCPWDREQTAATIVPHTIEEAFEVAEAVAAGDPARQADEIGDLLFQSVFLAQLLEEQGHGDLGRVARAQGDKLVSRHPHVYGDAVAESAGRVLEEWERRKREDRADQGIFHDLPPGLPALAYASKAQKRAASVGFAFAGPGPALDKLTEEVGELAARPGADELGDVLFACVALARELDADPELALRAAAQRFRARVERAAALAAAAGARFEDLAPADQLAWYARAKAEVSPAAG
ncbi:MAG: nucleoside triphosphate pyrophosphohydrolase [Thermoleophilia bacterium]|nr:nucleoside triphosphate pyrophosphohydrolase [Thermoleophilia bacterium]